MTDLFCMVCGETPCQCKPRGRRRTGTRPAARVSSQPQPAQQTDPDGTKLKATRARAVKASPRQESTDAAAVKVPEVMARNLRPSDIDEAADFDLIEATRALAHMVDPRDLVAFESHLMPSDYLPPNERRAAWLTRRGVNNGASA